MAKQKNTYIMDMDDQQIARTVQIFMNSGLWYGDKVEFLTKFINGDTTAETLLELARDSFFNAQ